MGILLTETTMSIAERKTREKQKRINAILDAAEEVFFGGDGLTASMDEVASLAEVSKGTLYLYFKNKESLYLGIGVRANKVALDYLQIGINRGEKGIDKVLEAVKSYNEFARKYPHYFRLKSFSDEIANRPFREGSDDPQMDLCMESGMACGRALAGAIESGILDGTIRSDIDPMTTTLLIWSQSNGVIKLIESKGMHLKERMGIDPDKLFEAFQKFVHRSIAA